MPLELGLDGRHNPMDTAARAITTAAEKIGSATQALLEISRRQDHAAAAQPNWNKPPAASGGLGGGLAGFGSKFGAGIAMTDVALTKVAKAAEVLNNSFTTVAQKSEALAAQFIPLVGSFIRLRDAVTGVTDAIARQGLGSRLRTVRADVTARYGLLGRAAEYEQSGYAARAGVFGGGMFSDLQSFDRGTVGGRIGYGDYQTRLGAMDAVSRAAAERDAALSRNLNARGGRESSLAAIGRAEGGVAAAQARVNEMYAKENSGIRDKVGVDRALLDLNEKNAALARERARYEAESNRAKEAGLDLARRESDLRKANIELQKAELSVLQQREARQSGIAGSVGMMGIGERIAGFQAAGLLNQFGFDNAPPEILQLASRIAPGFVQAGAERSGESFIRGQGREFLGDTAFGNIFGGDFQGDMLKDIRAKVDKVQADVRISIGLDEQKLARDLAQALGPLLGDLVKQMKLEIETVQRGITIGNQQRQNLGFTGQ